MDGTMSWVSSRMQDGTLHACREQGRTHKPPSAQHPFINWLLIKSSVNPSVNPSTSCAPPGLSSSAAHPGASHSTQL